MSRGPRAGLHAVILAGGAGERFWPASRASHPKQFLEVIGEGSLLDATLARARRIAGKDRVWVVCGKEQARVTRKATGLPQARLLVEPRRRNTAMAIAFAAHRIRAEEDDAVMAVLPADHYIPDGAALARDVRLAARGARQGGALVTLGVKPRSAATVYGYIQAGDPVGAGLARLRKVRRFVEKPGPARARRFFRDARYLWNAGIFVWTARTVLDEIEACSPDLHRALAPLRRSPKGGGRVAVEAAYARAPSLPIDVAVMERSERVWTLPVRFAWSDVGTWGSLAEELGVGQKRRKAARGASGEELGNRVIDGDVLLQDARNNLVWGNSRLVALLGVEDLAVVDTGDVILVTKLDRSPDVRRLVAALKRGGRHDLT